MLVEIGGDGAASTMLQRQAQLQEAAARSSKAKEVRRSSLASAELASGAKADEPPLALASLEAPPVARENALTLGASNGVSNDVSNDEASIRAWVRGVLVGDPETCQGRAHPLEAPQLLDDLRDGAALCDLLNALLKVTAATRVMGRSADILL